MVPLHTRKSGKNRRSEINVAPCARSSFALASRSMAREKNSHYHAVPHSFEEGGPQMQVTSIGAGSSTALSAWADIIAAGANRQAGIDRLLQVASTGGSKGDLLGAIATSGLSSGTQVQLSDSVSRIFAGDAKGGDATVFGELAQALMVALILQLLDVGGTSA